MVAAAGVMEAMPDTRRRRAVRSPSSRLRRREGVGRIGSVFFAAVAWRDVLLLRVCSRGLFDHRPHQLAVRLDPIGDHFPLIAVPLLKLDRTATLVIAAG